MDNVAADARYEVSYRSAWGSNEGTIGHLVIRLLDDHTVVAEIPATSEAEARDLLARADASIHGAAVSFEREWGLPERTAPTRATVPSPHVLPVPGREPVRGERIVAADERVHVLPGPDEVFVADQPWLEALLHPLVSIDLAAVAESWTGRVHLLSPVEPEEGLLGEATTAHHNEYTGVNWISFHLDDASRYRFLGERRYFEAEDAAASGSSIPELAAHYAQAETEYEGTRARWERLRALVWGDEDDPTQQRDGWGTDIALVDRLGGDPGWGNWTSYPPPPALRLDQSEPVKPVLRLADGRPFTFVAATAGYPWRETGADSILLFIEPETRTVVLTFDWS